VKQISIPANRVFGIEVLSGDIHDRLVALADENLVNLLPTHEFALNQLRNFLVRYGAIIVKNSVTSDKKI